MRTHIDTSSIETGPHGTTFRLHIDPEAPEATHLVLCTIHSDEIGPQDVEYIGGLPFQIDTSDARGSALGQIAGMLDLIEVWVLEQRVVVEQAREAHLNVAAAKREAAGTRNRWQPVRVSVGEEIGVKVGDVDTGFETTEDVTDALESLAQVLDGYSAHLRHRAEVVRNGDES